MSAQKLKSQKKSPQKSPNIFEYHDYLQFLKDWFQYRKSTENKFSIRSLSSEADIAVGYLPMVFSGKRTLTEKAFERLMPHLKLSSQELKYLQLLRTVGESEEPQVRLMAIDEMSRLAPFRKAQSKEVDVYKYLTRWYYVAIREMVALDDFDPRPEWIQARLKYSLGLKECQEALHFLEEKGFVAKTSDGKYFMPDPNLDCKEGIFKASLGEFHRQMLELGYKAITDTAREERQIMGHTLAVSSADIPELKQILSEAIEKIEKLGLKAKGKEQVYQVEVATFPLTKPMNKKAEGK